MSNSSVVHAMTVDVEDYFHVSAFYKVISQGDWDKWPTRVEENTLKLLDLFEQRKIKCTFFVLGWVAERFPELIRKLSEQGHEIASHGYSHQLVYTQTPEVFREETKKSKDILEQITQQPILGYRAASYSITRKSLWALDILDELGFEWDSSIFPVHHDNYGVPGSPTQPYTIELENGNKITEFPLTSAKVMGMSIPAAGGGYFRQYPYALSRWLFERASVNQTRPLIFYLHPWEIDPDQPRVPNASFKSKFRHYTNLHRCYGRLERMINDFNFGTIQQSLGSVNIDQNVHISTLR
ncbi:XrtA system polysaccharide deacetylase [Saccharophagus degradans]|uniref:Polysaccharide deacetylase-like protein n=1 Tax=Saccharophagus degradans (strain 2-40 / ATCC 43961 / DSM 17024) TaxID=203122 RepID=Q21PH6_SACD2|nr:XrtA system polysaccharide deacetylase [Saccharophagus degradans]ABD79403.1 polysaccharide deacetylase-like protein [Saccharophagus degradans 2-40]